MDDLSRLIAELKQRKWRIATAESCTGGRLAATLAKHPGASEYFDGGVVAYHNRIKQAVLGVSKSTLENFGAVSEQTAAEMVSGLAKTFKTEVAVATTGVAGPGGGTKLKPVGMVCFGFYPGQKSKKLSTTTQIFSGGREAIIEQSIAFAIRTLLVHLNNE